MGWSVNKRKPYSKRPVRGHLGFTRAISQVKKKMKITGAQITAARNLLKITQAELAEASGVSERTVKRFEADETAPRRAILDKILTELERRGIEFTNGHRPPSSGDGIGVRLNFQKAAAFASTAGQARKEADH